METLQTLPHTPASAYNTINTTNHSETLPSVVGSVYNTKLNKYKLFLSEFLGMTTFILLSLSNVAIFSLMPGNMSWEGVAIAWGFNLLMGIKIAASSKGNAYLNPCIAVCDFVDGAISTCEFFIYLTAELLGAFVGAGITYGLHRNLYLSLENNTDVCGMFATYPSAGVNHLQAFFVEFIGTFLFAMIIFFVRGKGHFSSYAISMGLTAVVLSLGFQTAFSYNWARDFGPRLFVSIIEKKCFSYKDNYWFIPLLANFAGGGAGYLVHKLST